MKPCSASWRRWYDVAPVLSESSRAKVVAVAGPSTRRRISIFIRVGCDSARSPAADGVMDGVRSAMTANIPLQTTLCKQSLGELRHSPRQFGCRSGRIHSQIVGDYPGRSRAPPDGWVRRGMATHSAYVTRGQAFERDMDYLPDRITAEEGRSRDAYEPQPLERPTWPVEPGRYRLVAAKAC